MRQRFSFQDVIQAIGEEAGRALVDRYGGTTIAIPARANPGGLYDELAAVLGEVAARKLIQFCASLHLSIPRNAAAERNRRDMALQTRFDSLTAGGMSARKAVSQLAREFHLVESSVWRALKRPANPT